VQNDSLGFRILVIGICLKFGACDLGFKEFHYREESTIESI
jgi:hypothetical protein